MAFIDEKKKLTLSVSSATVEKAKKLGLNISDITEKILSHYTFEHDIADDDAFLGEYRALFKTILPLIRKYNISLKVGDVDLGQGASQDFYLEPNGVVKSFLADNYDDPLFVAKIDELGIDAVRQMFKPVRILEGLISQLESEVENQKETTRELKMVRKIIEAMNESMTSSRGR